MNLKQLLTPKNEDGSVDHRYQSIANQICGLAGEKCLAELKEFYEQTSKLESEYAAGRYILIKKILKLMWMGISASELQKP